MNVIEKNKMGKAKRAAVKKADPFTLPRSITKQLRKCVQAYVMNPDSTKTVDYLWVNFASQCSSGEDAPNPVKLNQDDWLNVVDEAAVLGAHFMVVCIGETFSAYPYVWKICQWAQEVHGFAVGFHLAGTILTEADMNALKVLDGPRTMVFVPKDKMDTVEPLREAGIPVYPADVDHRDEKWPPCTGPQSMIFVGPEGMLYSCGLVVGKEQFRLGSAQGDPISVTLKAKAGLRMIPAGINHSPNGCDGCPNRMIKKINKPEM
jgi:hypothetical protein